MPTFVIDIVRERELDGTETSTERFDRMAFAERAVSPVKPPNMRVAIAEGRSRVVDALLSGGVGLDAVDA
jgi:hypothetical protein